MANDSPLPLIALAGAGYLLWKYYGTPAASPSTSIPAAPTPNTIYGYANPSYGAYQPPAQSPQQQQAPPPASSPSSLLSSFFPNVNTAKAAAGPTFLHPPAPVYQPPAYQPPAVSPQDSYAAQVIASQQAAALYKPNNYVVAATNPAAQAPCPAYYDWIAQWTYITGDVKPGAPPPPTCP